MSIKTLSLICDSSTYVFKTNRSIKFSDKNTDNFLICALKEKYDLSGEGDIDAGKEMESLISDLSLLIDKNGEFDNYKLMDYLHDLVPDFEIQQLLKDFVSFIKSFISTTTDLWVVQNGQSIDNIAEIYLRNTQSSYTNEELLTTRNKIKQMNRKHLDNSGDAFMVGRKIKLPSKIDVSDEKVSKNPVYDYVWQTQSKRILDISEKYNRINKKGLKSQAFADAESLANAFIKRYGNLNSSSMEHLILEPHFSANETTCNNIAKVRAETWLSGSAPSRSNKTDKLVKQYKTANCGECAELLTRMAYEKFGDKYEISQYNFNAKNEDGFTNHNKEHVALLIESKIGDEKYVVDTWINPQKGGIFKKSDWEQMMKDVYCISNEEIEFYKDGNDFREFNQEQLFWDNIPILQKEIPIQKLESLDSFRTYVEQNLRYGKHFSNNTLNIFKQYYSSVYDEIFDNQKDFYAKRNTIAKEVSPRASAYISEFGSEVLDGLLEGKEYSNDVKTLFREFCPDKAKDYDKTEDIRKHYRIIYRLFTKQDAEKMLSHYFYFCEKIWSDLRDGKKYPSEIMELYYKYAGYRLNSEESAEYAHLRIQREGKKFESFKSNFYKNMTPKFIHDYLHSISDKRAFLLCLEADYEELITKIDTKFRGWGNGNKKRSLIMPFVNFIANAASEYHIDEYLIGKFKVTCKKELNAIFYTDETEIIQAFKSILSKINADYRERGCLPS